MGKFKNDPPLCQCNSKCLDKVKWNREKKEWNKYARWHYQRSKEFKLFLKGNQYKKGHKHTKEYCEIKRQLLLGNKYGKKLKGRVFTEEHCQNLSIAMKNKPKTKEHCKNLSIANIGKIRSSESIEKQSLSMSGPLNPNYGKCGELSHCWKGGVSNEEYCDVWIDRSYKQSVKNRDDNECQNPFCRKNCNHLPLGLHHIDHNKQECNPEDIITLCNSCNSRANYNRKYWQNLYQNIMTEKYGYNYKQIGNN